jgi:hypothetical protein
MDSFVRLKTTQNRFLEDYLRGTNRRLTCRQASATFGIKNLRARMSELRKIGLDVSTVDRTLDGRVKYGVNSQNQQGSRSRSFA